MSFSGIYKPAIRSISQTIQYGLSVFGRLLSVFASDFH